MKTMDFPMKNVGLMESLLRRGRLANSASVVTRCARHLFKHPGYPWDIPDGSIGIAMEIVTEIMDPS